MRYLEFSPLPVNKDDTLYLIRMIGLESDKRALKSFLNHTSAIVPLRGNETIATFCSFLKVHFHIITGRGRAIMQF